jgi:hypothetical protein
MMNDNIDKQLAMMVFKYLWIFGTLEFFISLSLFFFFCLPKKRKKKRAPPSIYNPDVSVGTVGALIEICSSVMNTI